ncbi:MAG: F0F1 ATP synthase subunit A [Veillonellaceae bacterium]|nr:F0F1 ATP synthase subunit A [Veillonellaceae bacterium]
MDTLMMTWIVMALVILIAVLATRQVALVPGKWQSVMEMAIEWLLEQMNSAMGPNGRKLAPLVITLFLFLLISNWLGLVPGFTSPTADLNTTLGLALMMITLVHVLGVMHKGLKYFKHFFEPYIPFVVINIIEELAKPITLSFRLFGNILAGEVLLIILGILVPYIVPTAWLAFSVFVGVIQAFIFTMLSMSYIGNSIRDEHH